MDECRITNDEGEVRSELAEDESDVFSAGCSAALDSIFDIRSFVIRIPAMNPKAEEWFDVVNERDEVIGRELRRIVHGKGLWHRAVHVLVFNQAGQIFLQKRSMLKDLSPGLWDSSCSGHLDSGEDYDTAAVRELGEEIGLYPATTPERWFRLDACEATGWEFCWIYRLKSEGPFVLHPEEIETGAWFAPAELARLMAAQPQNYCSSFTLIWQRVSRELGVG